MNLRHAYRDYPFSIPMRVKFFNLFRLLFRFLPFERFLVKRIKAGSDYWKKLIPPLYFYPEGSLRDGETGGILFRLDISKELEHSIYFSVVRDAAWNNLFVTIRDNFTIVDVGANIGYLTMQFAIRARKGVVHAFEPDSENFSKLANNVAMNKLNNVLVYQSALGSQTGTAELVRLYKNNPGTNRILRKKPPGALSAEIVAIKTLDSYQEEGYFSKGIDLIKIDVEGFELFVLQGARDVIIRWRPLLFIELVDVNLRLNECSGQSVVEYVTGLGYIVLDAKTMKPLDRSDNYYTDILCLPGSNGIRDIHG